MVITGSEHRDHAGLTFHVGLGMVGWSSFVDGGGGRFFCSTRAASILPSRPRLPRPTRAGSVKAGRAFAVTRQGLALTDPSTAAPLIARDHGAVLDACFFSLAWRRKLSPLSSMRWAL